MTGKELKELISEIPDNKTIVFEYSCFTFGDIAMITTKKSEMFHCVEMSREDFKEEFPGRNYCMISFCN